jgi:alkyl hydroperoxide reductase subunit AhpF
MEIASQIFSLLLGQYTTSKISLDAEEKNTLQSIQQILQEIFMRSNSIAAKTEMNDELVSLISRIISLLVIVEHPLDSLEKSSKSTNKDDNLLDRINAIEKEYLFEFSPVLRAYGIAEIKKRIQTKSFVRTPSSIPIYT